MNTKVNNSSLEFKPPVASTQFVKTVSSTAVSYADLTITIPAWAQYVTFQVQAQPMRATFDGTTPTATVGISLAALSERTVRVDAFKAMKFIREGASDVTLWGQFFGV